MRKEMTMVEYRYNPKLIIKLLFLCVVIIITAVSSGNAQTITLRTIDAGPYSPGSSIAVPFSINDASGCINQNNTFSLYISSTPGGAPDTQIGTFSGFYNTFVNGTLPSTLAAGSYNIEVRASSPAIVTSRASINVIAGTALSAKITSQSISSSSQDVFGNCNGRAGSFDFLNQSTPGSVVTAVFYNELSQATENTLTLNPSASFPAATSHYTILVKATNSGITATKAYALINNVVNTSFGATGSNTVCLINGKGTLVYNMDISSANGLQKNYPGNIYSVDWGDGRNTKYTYCQINASGGQITHDYTTASCGIQSNGHMNVFPVNILVTSPFCGSVGTQVTSYAKVLQPPTNSFTGNSAYACLNVPVAFTNTSFPGDDATSLTSNCRNSNAKYSWYVDGQLQGTNMSLSDKFAYTFTTTGTHTVLLKLQQSGDGCGAADYSGTVCVEAAPKPKFSLSDSVFCSSSVITPNDLSVVDNSCSGSIHGYTWTVTGPAPVAYAGGTNANSKQPQFKFSTAGTYKVMLSINAPCGPVNTPTQNIIINTNPVAKLAADNEFCGKMQLFTFDDKSQLTQATLTGTTLAQADTYTWAVTGGTYSFQNGTDANSKYPQILFADYGAYTVTVTHKNTCGSVTATQKLSFKQSPTVNAGPNQTGICPGNTVTLAGTITGPVPQSYGWIGGTGTFTPDRNTLNAVYTPSAAEIAAGQVKLTLQASTNNPKPCDVVTSDVLITINPTNNITSAASKTICTGNPVAYQPVATIAGSTFTWTASATANASGFMASGTDMINDVITNTDAVNNAVVTYTITPVSNGCNGVPFTYKVTVTPNPVVTATLTNATICSGINAGIVLTSNLPGTTYTWTSTASTGVTGNTNQSTPVSVAKIDEVLNTTATTTASTVTYIITPISANGCTGTPVTVTVNILPPPVQANAGTNDVICNSPVYVLNGNAPAPSTGKWSQVSGSSAGVTFADATQPNTTVSGLVGGQQYVFRWTITGASTCAPSTSDVTITDLPAITSSISFNQPQVCQGQTITVLGTNPTGGNKTYTYAWQSSTDNVNWNPVSGQSGINLTILVTNTIWYRQIVTSGPCSSISNNVQINVLPPIASNTITADQTICANNQPALLTGSQATGGGTTYSYQWQNSVDNGKTWTDIPGANAISYQPPVLAVSTLYRRTISTQVCTGPFQNSSNAVSITVNPSAKANYVFITDKSCTPFVIDSHNIAATDYPDRNAQYTWYANSVAIGTGLAFPGYTINTDGQSVDIKLVATNKFNCGDDVFTHTFSTTKEVTAAITQSVASGCGPLTVNFTNASSPISNASFVWDFGNGAKSTVINPGNVVFQPDPSGKDITYTVTLTANTACGIKTTTTKVLVHNSPKTIITPDNVVGCSPFTVNMINRSVGGGATYVYDFGDGSPVQTVPDTQTVHHTYTSTKNQNFTIKATAQSACGIGITQSYTVSVSPNTVVPALVVDAPQLAGCAPWQVTFHNNTTGATSYEYDFGDGSPVIVSNAVPELINHTFLKGGTYTVRLKATNSCSTNYATQVITVYPQPEPEFTANITQACTRATVTFTNKTPAANTYIWDFGDGTTSTAVNPTHTFDYTHSPYTVTLTAMANLGCPGSIVKKSYITIAAPPLAEFTAKDSVIAYPDKNFLFTDRTSRSTPVTWMWSFGDGQTSSKQNPEHTYADTGAYKVRLIVYNIHGCADTVVHHVRITGTPGQMYLPNAFMPNSSNRDLATFKAIGSGIKEMQLRIYNTFGQLVWQTNKLNAQGQPTEGWDGTIRGQLAQQGVYIWEASATFMNGLEWRGMSYNGSAPKRSGTLNLVR
ncbi:PKD domain-containing protein [Mucilaginibacter sp. AW1-3]